ncbi:hypothetical protein AGLY_016801 [Aphis glycines]|uniref:Uncharacterized protein n=1 Tax=Aphis glycines TaxID=307491 RepID=A0A6G0SWZ0_APHGL|nr:hypothetical protein AGLY_016801 [Aphis glycines]
MIWWKTGKARDYALGIIIFDFLHNKKVINITCNNDYEMFEEDMNINLKKCVQLGLQEIAFLGHRNYGSTYNINQGNFKAILQYRSDGDKYLKSLLQKEGRNKYITPKIQNEIISVYSDIILQQIVPNDYSCLTVLADICNNLYGQAYDGVSNMRDHIQGVQAHILAKTQRSATDASLYKKAIDSEFIIDNCIYYKDPVQTYYDYILINAM